MQRLLELLRAYGNVLLFVALQLVAYWLLVRLNPRHGAAYSATLSELSGSVQGVQARATGFLGLGAQNRKLVAENAALHVRLTEAEARLAALQHRVPLRRGFSILPDSLLPAYRFGFTPCRAIGNSVSANYNYIQLNAGARHGLRREMGLMSPDGVAGVVVSVSENYAVAMSLLNKDCRLSARLRRKEVFGTLNWKGGGTRTALLEYVPLHFAVAAGDTVVTSAYSPLFPEGMVIGTVARVRPDERGGFHYIEVRLATDFHSLDYLYAVQNVRKPELDSLLAPFRGPVPQPLPPVTPAPAAPITAPAPAKPTRADSPATGRAPRPAGAPARPR